MNLVENPMRLKAALTYDAASDHFDHPDLGFWERQSRRSVELLRPHPGSRILDVGCGTGASALPAAAAVGPDGQVTGIDVAEKMLERARAKAAARGLTNVTFALTDMSALAGTEARYDAVISVFSVFFVQDVARQVADLWQRLLPGGRLAITVWADRAFEPGSLVFGEEVRRLRPDIPVAGRPWERFTEPDALRRLLLDGGTTAPDIHRLPDRQPLRHPGDWWTIAKGSGFRWEIDQLTPAQSETVRLRTTERLGALGTTSIEVGALSAIACKPG